MSAPESHLTDTWGRFARPVVLLTAAVLSVGLFSLSAPGAARAQDSGTLVLNPLFSSDAHWESLTHLGDDDPDRDRVAVAAEIQAEVQTGGSTPGGGWSGSLDADAVAALVADRARQVGLRAIADAIRSAAGPGADRRYVHDLLEAAEGLLFDGGRLPRAHVERLVKTIVRMVVAQLLVETRFPDLHRLNRSEYWIQRLCTAGEGYRHPTADEVRHCARLRLGLPSRDVSATAIHLYLLDLAYWRLGTTSFIDDYNPEPPSCPFEFGEPGNPLCQVLTSGRSDDERNGRVDWALNLRRVMDGLHVVRALQPLWSGEGAGFRSFLTAVVESRNLGAFGRTVGLRPRDWSRSRALVGHLGELAAFADVQADVDALYENGEQPDALPEDLRSRLCHAARPIFHQTGMCWSIEQRSNGRQADIVPVCTQAFDEWLQQAVGRVEDFGNWNCESPVIPLVEGDAKLPRMPRGSTRRWNNLAESVRHVRRVLRELEDDPVFDQFRSEDDELTLEQFALAIGEANASLRASVFGSGADFRAEVSISTLRFERLQELVRVTHRAAHVFRAAIRVAEVAGASFAYRELLMGTSLQTSLSALQGTDRLLRLFRSLNLHAAQDRGVETIGSAIRGVESLAVEARRGVVNSRVLDLVTPILDHLVHRRELESGTLFRLSAEVEDRDLLMALGFTSETLDACEVRGDGLACWTLRILRSLRESMRVTDGNIEVDGSVFRQTLAALGDDFRSRYEWRLYFHLTVGLGELITFGGIPSVPDDAGPTIGPLINEQIGFGIASPTFWDNRLTFRAGAFASGILYRLMLDSAESDAVMLGGFVALDLYELLEVYVAPTALFFPATDADDLPIRFGISIGAQVPLGDYLSSL